MGCDGLNFSRRGEVKTQSCKLQIGVRARALSANEMRATHIPDPIRGLPTCDYSGARPKSKGARPASLLMAGAAVFDTKTAVVRPNDIKKASLRRLRTYNSGPFSYMRARVSIFCPTIYIHSRSLSLLGRAKWLRLMQLTRRA